MKNQKYTKKLDRDFFKEREKVSKLFNNNFHKIIYLFLLVFIVSSCSNDNRKNLTMYGTGLGVGSASWALTKSFLGKSGNGGNIPTVIAVTTLGTILGTYWGSEIADNMFEDEQEVMNVSLNQNQKSTWKLIDDNSNKEIVTKIEPTEELISNSGQQRCKKFNFSMEESGYIKRGEGFACQNNQTGNWEMLGVELL